MRRRYLLTFLGLAVALVALLFWNIGAGSVSIPARDLPGILAGGRTDETAYQIIWSLRLPRLLSALLLGGALSVSGFLLQTFFHNPIAGPFVLGISSGAKLVVALTMIFLLGQGRQATSLTLIGAAFLGSLLCTGVILLLSRRADSMSLLIVGGVMIGYICSALTDFAVTFASDADIVNLHNWSMGSFSGMSWDAVGTMTAVVLPGAVAAFFLAKPIAAYQQGAAYAKSVGVNTGLFQVVLIVLSSLLSACVTAFAGPISFVGIAVPHLIQSLLGTSKPILVLPACFLGGGVCCLFCDLIARTVFAPTEISISSVTAIFGAPVVIFMLLRRQGEASRD
ncbi:MAG: iron ABC transporter permease [Oscillospiraceae bacterium]